LKFRQGVEMKNESAKKKDSTAKGIVLDPERKARGG
jgi:hypothetical protein